MRISALSGWSGFRGLGQTSVNFSTDLMVGAAVGAVAMIYYLSKKKKPSGA